MKNPLGQLATYPASFFTPGEIPATLLNYSTNRNGFRCSEFEDRKPINIMFLGDSWTEGCGVTQEESYPSMACRNISEMLGVEIADWNLGHGGKGYEYIARMLVYTLDVLNPDAVIITFPSMDRREYFAVDDNCYDLSISMLRAIQEGDYEPSPIMEDIYRNWKPLLSPLDDARNAIMNYKLIESLLNHRDIPWGFSTNDWKPAPERIAEFMKFDLFDARHYVGHAFEKLGQISDTDGHPDAPSHALHGTRIADWLLARYGSQLRECALAA